MKLNDKDIFITSAVRTPIGTFKGSLKNFQGLAFPVGFSYGDVLGAGKGWAQSIKSNSISSASTPSLLILKLQI